MTLKLPTRRTALLTSVFVLAGCQKAANLTGRGTVAGTGSGGQPVQATASQADPDMAQVITELQRLGAKPVSTLSVAQARAQSSIADAVRVVQRGRGMVTKPRAIGQVQNMTIPGAAGSIPARLYRPAGRSSGALPLIVYWHGGGWVIADIDTYDASARALAAETGAMVLSAHYRQAPEHKFPAAQDDAISAYAWAARNAGRLGADPMRVAVAGESAGGNLAINAAIAARDQRLPRPVHMCWSIQWRERTRIPLPIKKTPLPCRSRAVTFSGSSTSSPVPRLICRIHG
jgi:acetyl esterase